MMHNRTRRLLSRGAAAALFVFIPLAASAAPITVPTDLSVGDKYRLAFVTSTTRDAISADIADYNAFVSAVAATVPELAALGTTWTAIGSTSLVDARDNTATNPTAAAGVPIYRLDDTRVADDNADLWDGTLAAPISLGENGLPPLQPRAWTGSTKFGIKHVAFYLGATPDVFFGLSSNSFFVWMEFGVGPPDSTFTVYAMSDELTVVPEPGTMSLGWIGATAVVGWLLHRRRHRIRQ
jgi:hypothetical protein